MEVGRDEKGVAEVGVVELGPVEAGPFEVGEAEVGPGEVGPVEAGPFEVGRDEPGPSEVGPAEVGPAESGIWQVGAAEVGPAQVGAVESGDAEVGRWANRVGVTIHLNHPGLQPGIRINILLGPHTLRVERHGAEGDDKESEELSHGQSLPPARRGGQARGLWRPGAAWGYFKSLGFFLTISLESSWPLAICSGVITLANSALLKLANWKPLAAAMLYQA